jgi:hypothetical protein
VTVFIRLLRSETKAEDLRRNLLAGPESRLRYEVQVDELRKVPTSPLSYWVGPRVRALFDEFKPVLDVRQGLATADDFRFVRAWFEVSEQSEGTWIPAAKGGRRVAFFRDLTAVIRWTEGGKELWGFVDPKSGQRRSVIRNPGYYGRPGLTWPLRGVRFSAQVVPAGCAFTVAGKMAFTSPERLLPYLAVLNSLPFDALMGMFAGKVGGVQYEVGLVERTPLPMLDDEAARHLTELARRGWRACRSRDEVVETSHSFSMPAVLRAAGRSLGARVRAHAEWLTELDNELLALQRETDRFCFELYRLGLDDRKALTESFSLASQADGEDDDGERGPVGDAAGGAAELVSWAVGVCVGRFDVRLAIGKRAWPEPPAPFDRLPECSSGMLTNEDGLPLDVPPADYPVEVSPVLVDDPGHRLHITDSVRSLFAVVFGSDADAWWSDVGEALNAKGPEISSFLSKGFFEHHLKTYSKSRRQAPIFWPLGTTSGAYLVWLYAHRVTSDSLFLVLNDLVSPKLVIERRRLSDLVQEFGPNPSANQRKAIYGQERLVVELQEFVDELSAVAPLWHPDLNDGIVVVLAPLWRLFAHHKPWSKELRKHWDSLVGGEYDWAQLAMHLWPERVVPKCAEDRSLAIAHGLEDVFWIQNEANPDKWHIRKNATVSVDQLITDRTDPAVKAALADAVR